MQLALSWRGRKESVAVCTEAEEVLVENAAVGQAISHQPDATVATFRMRPFLYSAGAVVCLNWQHYKYFLFSSVRFDSCYLKGSAGLIKMVYKMILRCELYLMA
jgi:hypothetical protein